MCIKNHFQLPLIFVVIVLLVTVGKLVTGGPDSKTTDIDQQESIEPSGLGTRFTRLPLTVVLCDWRHFFTQEQFSVQEFRLVFVGSIYLLSTYVTWGKNYPSLQVKVDST